MVGEVVGSRLETILTSASPDDDLVRPPAKSAGKKVKIF